jgi:homocysteine S-methyltransferase
MINCAHPTHFEGALVGGGWLDRITGIRANSSTMSHAELEAAEELDDGDPVDLAERYRRLLDRLPALELLGGCCGTDERHLRAIGEACCRS